MKVQKLLMFFVIFMTENFSIINSEYVTLFTPKFVQEDAIYRLFVYPTDLKEVTDIAIQFRKTSATYRLDNGKIGAIEYNSKQRNFGDIRSYDMTMTLMRNVTLSSGLHHYCTSRNISVQTKTGNFYNFIQTDKPIYKPGDTVQFRILTVDKDLLPYHRDSINVTITDPQGHPIYNFQNQAGKYIGVFDDNFTLSTDTTLGDWMITVVVDRRSTMAVSKIFAVQKYTLPLFDITIDLTDTHVLSSDDLCFSFYAKYSFGEYVKGYAEIMIREPVNKHVYFKESFFDIQSPKSVTKNLDSIGAYTYDVLQLEVVVVFTEPQSGIRFNKSAPFFVHAGDQHKIVAVHSDKFLPGFPFLLKVNIYDWKNELVMDSVDDIEITWSYTQQMGITGSKTNIEHLTNGVFKTEFDVPMNYVELSVDINFLDSEPYHQDIEMGSTNVGMNTLVVSHAPNSPNLNDTVKIFVSSDQQLNNLIYAVVTRYGNTDARLVKCNGKQPCEFDIKIEEQMMPHSTVMVYYVKSQQVVFQGKTKIETRNLGENYLTIDLPSTKAKTKEAINMKISTKQKSKVYMLAFDKRLTYLRDGNDITKDDVVTSVADYDGENNILVDDLSLWKECTSEEIERVDSGRTYVTNQGGTDTVIPHEPDDSMEFFLTSFPNPDLPKTKNGLLRQYFPETWIFETIEVGPQSEFEKTYTVPDSMTTWLLSAFSIHNDYGLAVSSRQDLVVKDEFFIQLNLPYSIRYTEVLKLEVLVFNYIDAKENITVDLKLNNLNTDMVFQFVDYSVDCEPSYHDGTSASSKVSVEANGMSTIHFYVRSNPCSSKKCFTNMQCEIP